MEQILKNILAVIVILFRCPMGKSLPSIDEEVNQLIYEHAPLIWLHSEEVFYPSTIEFLFENTEVRDANEGIIQQNPTRSTILTGPETAGYHLNSVPDLECADCHLNWFTGQDVSQVPVYTYVRQHDDACGTLDVAYRANFPYNYGKDVCIGIQLGDFCFPLNEKQSFGNHVGDWEHFALRFLNGQLSSAYISVHSFGAAYIWNETANNFYFVYGERFLDNAIKVEYPEFINIFDGKHVEIFSANGSHGMWSQSGTYQYMNFPVSLEDKCDRGNPWMTWENLEIIPYEENYLYDGDYTYIKYAGRWGNQERDFGVLSDGPRHYRAFPNPTKFKTFCEE